MEKEKILKKSYTFRPKVNEAPEIIDFLIEQTNFNDAIRYLIEKEVIDNGIRDIVKFIPSVREIKTSLDTLDKKLSNASNEDNNIKNDINATTSNKKEEVLENFSAESAKKQLDENVSNEFGISTKKDEEIQAKVEENNVNKEEEDVDIPSCFLP